MPLLASDEGVTFPSYKVLIVDTVTGEERIASYDMEWSEGTYFLWTDGNFGCDCNRGMEFNSAGGQERGSHPCAGRRFKAVKAIFPNGDELLIDDSEA